MRIATRLALLLAVSLGGACGGDGDGDGGGGSPLAAAWRYVSGPAFTGPQDLPGTLKYVLLEPDGTARLTLQDESSGTLFCYFAVYAPTDGGLIMEVRRDYEDVTVLFLRDQPDPGTLELTDANGGVSVFAREASVPAEFQCGALVVRATHPGLAATPTYFTGMAYDGTSLWFTDVNEDDIYPVDPLTGALGSPILFDNSQFQMVHAAQGTDFWLHCRCGGSQEAQRRTQADAFVDEVDTVGDLAHEIGVRGIAYDPVADDLWLHGYRRDGPGQEFLRVDASGEPDVLLDSRSFDVTLRSMTWDGTHMWAVTDSQNVIQVDMATFTTLATYESPDVNVEWIGIASAPASLGLGNSLYLIGRDAVTGDGVLLEVQP